MIEISLYCGFEIHRSTYSLPTVDPGPRLHREAKAFCQRPPVLVVKDGRVVDRALTKAAAQRLAKNLSLLPVE